MKLTHYTREDGLSMTQVDIHTNDFTKEHPALGWLIQQVVEGKLEEDLTIEKIGHMPDERIPTDWEKARFVVESIACLYLAELSASWGCGYRSDDGFDYLQAALDNVRFLSDIDLTEADFRMWWEAGWEDDFTSSFGYYIGLGATDGEIRLLIFPQRLAS